MKRTMHTTPCDRWPGWALAALGIAVLAGTPALAWAEPWQPNLTLHIAGDDPIHAPGGDPFRIVLRDYQSSSIPGLRANDLLIELLMNNDGTVGFVLGSTSSGYASSDTAKLWYDRPDDNAPDRINFDVFVSVDTTGLFPEAVKPYQTLTHLLADFLAVQGGGSGAADPTGALADAFAAVRGYGIGPDLDDPSNTRLVGETAYSFLADPGNPIYTTPVAPPDAPGEVEMVMAGVRSVLSLELGHLNGVNVEVSARLYVTMVPEPASAALLTAGGLLMVRRRRRPVHRRRLSRAEQ